MKTILSDTHVLDYQKDGASEGLVEQYQNFLNKYRTLLTSDAPDYSNYDVRCFLALFIGDAELNGKLRSRHYREPKVMAEASRVVDQLKFRLRNYSPQEVEAELLVPFLECAQLYQDIGAGFNRYLYSKYRYSLKEHLDDHIKLDAMDQKGTLYIAQFTEDMETELPEEQDPKVLMPDLDDDMLLTNPRWIAGKIGEDYFTNLKPHERYILHKYYGEEKTDKEIARMLPYNPKSIHRIRMRMVRHFKELYNQGELKWIRFQS